MQTSLRVRTPKDTQVDVQPHLDHHDIAIDAGVQHLEAGQWREEALALEAVLR